MSPVSILHLADELLLDVFTHCTESPEIDLKTAPRTGIKNIRLTCRRFCAASSSLLIPSVRVGLDASSLARLDQISRHPVLGKGVRHVRICARPYDVDLTRSITAFAHQKATLFRQLETCRMLVLHIVSPLEHTDSAKSGISKLSSDVRQIRKMARFLENIRIEKQCPEEDRRLFSLLTLAFEEYRSSHEAMHRMISEGSFHAAIAESMARMPLASAVSFTDEVPFLSGSSEEAVMAALRNEKSFMRLMASPLSNIRNDKTFLRLSSMPAAGPSPRECNSYLLSRQLFLLLPMRITQAGTMISSLTFDDTLLCVDSASTRWDGPRFPAVDEDVLLPDELATASSHLRHFVFRPFTAYSRYVNPVLDEHVLDVQNIYPPLTSLLSSTLLETVELDFVHWPCPDFDFGPLLGAFRSTRLRSLILRNIMCDLDELRPLLPHLKSNSGLEELVLDGVDLKEGTWEELLDGLRGCFVSPDRMLPSIEITEPSGSDLLNLRGSEGHRIWEGFPSPAVRYVIGDIDENPLGRRHEPWVLHEEMY